MLKLATIPLILAAFFAAPGSHDAARSRGPHSGMFLSPQAIQELALTDEQISKIKDLKDTRMDKTLEIRQKMEKSRLELAKLTDDNEPNQTKIETKIREIGNLKTEMELERINFFFQVRKLLTPEQIEKLGTIHAFGRNPGGRSERPCRDAGPDHD